MAEGWAYVEVQFPDGLRKVPAHLELPGERIGIDRRVGFAALSRLVPDDQDGVEFREIIGGKWYAYRVPYPTYYEHDHDFIPPSTQW